MSENDEEKKTLSPGKDGKNCLLDSNTPFGLYPLFLYLTTNAITYGAYGTYIMSGTFLAEVPGKNFSLTIASNLLELRKSIYGT